LRTKDLKRVTVDTTVDHEQDSTEMPRRRSRSVARPEAER